MASQENLESAEIVMNKNEAPGNDKGGEETSSPPAQEPQSPASDNQHISGNQEKQIIQLNTSPSDKIRLILKPAGSTPALTKPKWNVTRDKTIGSIATFVKKPLKMDAAQTLFIYVKQTFAPSADVCVGQLYDCFGSDGQLVLHYCATEAWG